MDTKAAMTAIKGGLATVSTNDWNVRVALCLAVQTIENELNRLEAEVNKYQQASTPVEARKP